MYRRESFAIDSLNNFKLSPQTLQLFPPNLHSYNNEKKTAQIHSTIIIIITPTPDCNNHSTVQQLPKSTNIQYR